MASVADTIKAYSALATRIYQAADSGLLSTDQSARLSQLLTALNAAQRNFHARPADGPASPSYDGALKAANDASTELGKIAHDNFDPSVTAISAAIQALSAVTARTSSNFGLRGSLRLEPAPVADRAEVDVAQKQEGAGGDPNYYNKLITLFPAEALTLYGTGIAIFGGAAAGSSAFWVIIVCLIVLLLVRWKANQPKTIDGPTDRPAVAVALVSFLLWATATDPSWLASAPATLRFIPGDYDPDLIRKWAAFLGAAFVFVAPNFIALQDSPDE